MSDNKNRDGAYGQLAGIHRAIPIILVAIAIFIATCFITENTGVFGVALSNFLLGCFSIGGYFIPALFAVHAIFYPSDIQKKKRLISRIIFSLLLVITVSALTHAVYAAKNGLEFSTESFYALGKEAKGGGFIGGVIAYGIITVVDYVGLIILSITFLAIYATYFLSGEKNPVGKAFRRMTYKFVSFGARTERKFAERKKNKQLEKERRKNEKNEKAKKKAEDKRSSKHLAPTKDSELYDDDFFAVDNGLSELKIEELGINESRRQEDIEKNPTLQEKVFPKGEIKKNIPEEEPYSRRSVRVDYGFEAPSYTVNKDSGDIVMDDIQPTETKKAVREESAESAFGQDFTPFDFEINERLASKPSSAAVKAKESASYSEYAETVTPSFSEEEIREARRKADFEARRAQLVNEERERLYREGTDKRTSEPERIDIAKILGEKPSEEELVTDEKKTEKYTYTYENTAPVSSETNYKSDVYAPDNAEKTANAYNYKRAAEYARVINQQPEETPKRAPETLFSTYEAPIEKTVGYAKAADVYEPTLTINRTPIVEEPPIEREDKNDETLLVFDGELSTAEAVEEESVTEADISDLLDGFTAPIQTESGVFDFSTEDDEEDTDPSSEPVEDGGVEFDFGEEIPKEKQNPEINEYRKMFDIFSEVEVAPSEEPETVEEVVEDDFKGGDVDAYEEDVEDDDDVPFDIPAPIKPQPKAASKPAQDAPVYEKPDYSSFKFPPIDLLTKGQDSEDTTITEETNETGARLIDALLQFDVRATIKGVDRGPRITRYEVVPARGVRVSKVIGLFDDIALNLAAEGIRMEAPIPGKSAIGVEIPNKHPATVMLRDLIESDEFVGESSKTFACVGKDVTGNPVFGDIAKMPHILVAGATGMGKSVCINSILVSILYKARPDEVKFIMIDPKTVEFTMYNGIPHLLIPVVTDVKQAAGALMWAIDEMNKRYELMAKHEVRKLDSYNDLVRANPELGEPLPKIIIVVDELNDLMQQVRKPVEGLITNITQKARAAGIHMIIGTQRPSVDVITGVIKANIPSRISCKVTALTDSRTILDQAGAEKLLDKGDMLFAPVGKPKPIRVQGAFVSDLEVEKIMKFLKSNVKGSVYDQQALEEINRAAQKCSKGKDDDDFDDDDDDCEEGVGYLNDKQFLDAVDLAIRQGKISTSLIQRKLSIGYGKAAKFIDIMEDMSLVSEPNGQKPRDVLVSRDEWQEMLSRRSLDD